MNATITDFRYRTKKLLDATDHGEKVTIFYRGKPWATLAASAAQSSLTRKKLRKPK